MSSVGGVRPSAPAPQAAPVQKKAPPPKSAKPRATKETFGNTKAQVKLPTTSKNAMTQMKSKDQMKLMKMSQEKHVGKLSENLKGARKSLQTDVLPKSIIGAGQSIPPAPMRAMAALRGSLFAGRAFEINIGKENSTLSFRIGGKSFNSTVKTKLKRHSKRQEEDEDDELEEDL